MNMDEGKLIIEDNTIYEIDLECQKHCNKEEKENEEKGAAAP